MDAQIVAEKMCKKCGTTKPATAFHKCSRNKSGLQSKCVACMNAYYMANQDKLIARTREWERNHKDRKKAWREQWIHDNPDKRKAVCDKYYKNNKDKARSASKKWKTNNKGKLALYASVRRATKFNSTPIWADMALIEREYELAAWCTKVTGEKYHVDHIIPLRGKKVCGLHVHTNMQVIRQKENLTKSNKFAIE